jgi:pimeloyl-ACP methyl ester carboxylesterase
VNFSTYETQTGERHLCCPPWLEAAVFGSAPEMLWRDIPKLKTPTYIVWGTQTLDVFQQSYQRIRQEGSDIRFVEVQGGHCFMMQYPTQSARLVRALIDQNVDEIRALQHSGFVINFDD